MDTWPVNPVRRLSPIAAIERYSACEMIRLFSGVK